MITLDYIIDNDPTLKFLIKDANIDWFNQHQVNLRFAALKIALAKLIDRRYLTRP